ncbi:MAG: hypothetical protein H7138_08025 [Myxococcales bacterium]|nr:hypothetical protein [Myxococcales bacterium]
MSHEVPRDVGYIGGLGAGPAAFDRALSVFLQTTPPAVHLSAQATTAKKDGMFMITTRRTAWFLALALVAGSSPALAGKASDQARKDAAAHSKKGNDSAAAAAKKRAESRAAQEQRNQRNADRKRR